MSRSDKRVAARLRADVSVIQRQDDQQKAFSLAEKVGNSLANWSDKGFAEGDRTQALVYALLPSP